MTNTTARTPGPWKVEEPMGPDILFIIARGDRQAYEWLHVAQVSGQPTDEDDISSAEARANAAFIVRAANSHDELVAALEEVECKYRDGYGLQCIEQVRAALAKARQP